MAYEYEGYVKNTIRTVAVFSHEIEQKYDRILELEEVYRKAKAFDEIREIEDEYYNKYGELITVEELVYTVDTILDNYERSEREDDER